VTEAIIKAVIISAMSSDSNRPNPILNMTVNSMTMKDASGGIMVT
jgi:hypothetical protein